jgi:hypothetical protein
MDEQRIYQGILWSLAHGTRFELQMSWPGLLFSGLDLHYFMYF